MTWPFFCLKSNCDPFNENYFLLPQSYHDDTEKMFEIIYDISKQFFVKQNNLSMWVAKGSINYIFFPKMGL